MPTNNVATTTRFELTPAQWTTVRAEQDEPGGSNQYAREEVVEKPRTMTADDKEENTRRNTPTMGVNPMNNVRGYLRSVNNAMAGMAGRLSRMREEQT